MLVKERFYFLSQRLFLVIALIGFSALWYSSFLVSLSTALIGILALPYYRIIWEKHSKSIICLAVIISLSFFDLFRSGSLQNTSFSKLGLLAGLCVLLLSALYFFSQSNKYAVLFILISSVIVLIINGIAVTNYFMHKAFYDELLLQSKSIPVLRMHHIHFGIINASTVFLLFGILKNKLVVRTEKVVSWILLILILVCFHILSSRTGILAFYTGALISLFTYSVYKKKYKTLIVGLVLACASLLSSALISTSFRNKINNSIEDYESIRKGGKEINFKSMAMRLEANKICLAILAQHPLFGVGANEQDNAIQKMYKEKNTLLLPQNRVGPHNQFLEFGVKYGLMGVLILLALFISFIVPLNANAYFYYGFLGMLFISMFFESLFERQASIFFISLFLGVGYSLFYGQIAEK